MPIMPKVIIHLATACACCREQSVHDARFEIRETHVVRPELHGVAQLSVSPITWSEENCL
jgi:hypothetical protein